MLLTIAVYRSVCFLHLSSFGAVRAKCRSTHRYDRRYRHALSRTAVDPEFTVECLNALAHTNQTEARRRAFDLLRKSLAVVAHNHLYYIPALRVIAPCNVNVRTSRSGMASNVGQTFLDDAVHSDVDGFAHPLERAMQTQITRDSRVPFTPCRDG